MLLVSDPWDTIRRWWPIPRALLRREKIPWPIEIHLATLTASMLRVVTAAITAVGAGLSTACARALGGHWWLLALLPAPLATAAYTLAGNDSRLRAMIKAAVRDISDNLSTPATSMLPPGTPVPRPRIAVLDNAWLHERLNDLRQLVTPLRLRPAPWLALLAVLWATVMLTALTPALGRALEHSLDGHALAATVDRPVHRYLASHARGLPLTAQDVHVLWLAAGLSLLFLAITGSLAARLTWTAWGSASIAMVWTGSAVPGRQVATAITALAWGIASVIALHGMRLRSQVSVINTTNVNDQADGPHGDQPVESRGDDA